MSATAEPHSGAAAAPSPAVAPPPGSPRFALFDALRGIAVMFIIAFHVASITGAINGPTTGRAILALGNQALILFFVISAFLLYRPFVAARAAGRRLPSVRRYARRRVLRIVPAYWVALTVLGVFPGIVGVFSGDWWRYYGFSQLYTHDAIGKGIPPAWSLCVEVTFYLALPAWAWLMRRLPMGGASRWARSEFLSLAAVAAFGILMQVLASRLVVDDLVAQSLLGQSTWLALGMALAVWSVQDEKQEDTHAVVRFVSAHSGLCWLGALAAGLGLAALVRAGGLFGLIVALRNEQPYATTFATIALTATLAVLMVLPAVFGEHDGGVPRRVLRLAPVAWVGMVSYSIYLYHLAIAEVLGTRSDPAHFSASGLDLAGRVHFAVTPVLFVATFAASCAVAAVSYYAVELPFLRRKER